MLSSTLTTLLAFYLTSSTTTTTTYALPAGTQTHKPHTANVTYYQGNLSPSSACSSPAVAVYQGNITTNTCYTAYTYAMSVVPLAGRDCVYKLFHGSTDCGVTSGGDAVDEQNGGNGNGEHGEAAETSTQTVELAKGGAPVCVVTGVYDGGAHTYASGILHCK